MPLILATPHTDGSMNVMIVLGPDSVERMKEKDPVEVEWFRTPFKDRRLNVVSISYASDPELTQMEQLARQGKPMEAIKMAISGWKYRPEMGDHDQGPEELR